MDLWHEMTGLGPLAEACKSLSVCAQAKELKCNLNSVSCYKLSLWGSEFAFYYKKEREQLKYERCHIVPHLQYDLRVGASGTGLNECLILCLF